jgi:hypothetical protein
MRNYINFLLSKTGEKFFNRKEKSSFDFICTDPNCPHCAYDENATLVSDEEIYRASENLADPNICKTDNWIEGAKWMRSQYED